MVVSMNSNILIEGNTFDLGNSGIDGAIPYQYLILLNLDANGASDPGDSGGPGYAVVNSNYLNGVIADGYHIVVNSGSANITDNTFLGPGNTNNSVPVSAYINCGLNPYGLGSLMDHIITNNVFDSPTVDGVSGTNERLVIGPGVNGALTPGTIYTNNKNQTGYMPITKVPNLVNFYHVDSVVGTPDTAGSIAQFYAQLPNISSGSKQYDGFYNYASDSSFTASGHAWFTSAYGYFDASEAQMLPSNDPPFYPSAEGTVISGDSGGLVHVKVDYTSAMDVNQYLPPGVQILSFTVGLAADGYVQNNLSSPTLGSNYSLSASVKLPVNVNSTSYFDATSAAAALSQGMADVRFVMPLPGFTTPLSPIPASEATATLLVVGSAPAAGQTTSALLNAATQYLFLDVSSLGYNTGTGISISVIYQAETVFGPANPTTQTFVYESPLIVRYRW